MRNREATLTLSVETAEQAVTVENLLLREMSHRVNNEFSSAIGLLSVAASRSTCDEAQAALTAVQEQLQNHVAVHHSLQMPEYDTSIDLGAYLQRLCRAISRSKLEPRKIDLSLSLYPVQMSSERCWLLGMIVFELITNSARHAFAGRCGAIRLELFPNGQFVECRISDDGASDADAQAGCGLKIVEALARRLSGDVNVQFGANGTLSTILFRKDVRGIA